MIPRRHRALAPLMLALLVTGWPGVQAGGGESGELQDRAALDFRARTLDGGELQLSSLKGKVVLLNFWGIWCIPCRKEIPKLQAMYEELHGRGLEIVGIDVGDEADAARKYVTGQAMSYPVLLGEDIAGDYDVEVFPTNIIIDRAGRVRHVEEGYDDETTDLLRDIIERLLVQKPSHTGGGP